MNPTVPINLDQLFLPYFNLYTDQSGWQFGLPVPKNLKGMSRKLAKRADVSILIVMEDGTVKYEPHPILAGASPFSPQTRPPSPQWAWVPFSVDGSIDYARLVCPSIKQSSVPLSGIPKRTLTNRAPEKVLLTPEGIRQHKTDQIASDIQYDITLKSDFVSEDGAESEITLGQQLILRFAQHNGRISAIYPSEWTFTHQLWTSHLYRVAQVLCTP